MIDYEGRNWTRSPDGELITREDGFRVGVSAEWTDDQCMSSIQRMAQAAADKKAAQQADAAELRLARAEPVIRYLVTHTNAQIEAYVDANVTNLASAKTLLGKLAVAVAALARNELR